MKRMLAILLCLCLMALGMVTAMATQDVTQTSSVGTSKVTLTVEASDPVYVLKIPKTIDFGTQKRTEESKVISAEFTVEMAEMKDFFGKKVRLTVTGSGAEGAFVLVNENDQAVPYTVYKSPFPDETDTAAPGEALFFIEEVQEYAGRIELDTKDIPDVGDYSGTMTFTAEIVEADVNE